MWRKGFIPVVVILTITTFLGIMSLVFIYNKNSNKQQNQTKKSSDSSQSKQIKELVQPEKPASPTNEIFSIFTRDKSRSHSSVCGYTEKEVNSFVKQSSVSDKLWSDDCSKLAYNVWHAYKALPEEGVWLYDVAKKTNVKLSDRTFLNVWDSVNVWLAPNVLVAGGQIIDIITGQKITPQLPLANTGTLNPTFMYRNPNFNWTFLYPKKWVLSKTEKFDNSDKISRVVFRYQGAEIAIYAENPNLDTNGYSDRFLNSGRESGYTYYYSENKSPEHIYINKDNVNYPRAITSRRIDEIEIYDLQIITNDIPKLIETIELF